MTAIRTNSREDALPRKVVVGTTIFGAGPYPGSVAERADELVALVDSMASAAGSSGLDLVVLPEAVLTPNAPLAPDRSVPLDDPAVLRLREAARSHRTYVVLGLDLAEDGSYANAAVLLDRAGSVAGIYRKAHPVTVAGEPWSEGGVTAGADFPVFACDFGKVGVQICWDVAYDDGWAALAAAGAELVAFPSASPATILPAAHAARHRYFVVSSTPRDNATVYEPTGLVGARIVEDGVLVHEVDLSFALLGWAPALRDGQAFKDRFGDRVDYHYSTREDIGMFWSDDPDTSIESMVAELGLDQLDAQVARGHNLRAAAPGLGPASGRTASGRWCSRR